jgi:hypothetical protein
MPSNLSVPFHDKLRPQRILSQEPGSILQKLHELGASLQRLLQVRRLKRRLDDWFKARVRRALPNQPHFNEKLELVPGTFGPLREYRPVDCGVGEMVSTPVVG